MTSEGGNQQKAGAGTLGGCIKTVPANFTVGEVGLGPAWEDDDTVQLTHSGWKTVTDKMAESIVRLEQENQELRAEAALAEAERIEMAKMLRSEREAYAKCQNALETYRDEACRESCRDKAQADGGWANI